jgi:FdhE protein
LTNKVNLSKQIQKGLEEWAGQPAHSSRFLDFYNQLLEIQAEAEGKFIPPDFTLSNTEISQRLYDGKPLINFAEFIFDRPLANLTFRRIVTLFNSHPEIMGVASPALTNADLELPDMWIKQWLENEEWSKGIIEEGIDPLLLTTLLNQTLKPFLIGYSQLLKDKFEQERWRRSYCPVCGGKPEFAYLEKNVGARYLLCSRCTTEWLYQRMECPYCHNNDHEKLSYLVSDNGLYRLYLCDTCQSYLKCIDARKGDKNQLMPLEVLTTLAMDRQAQEKGYHSALY